MNDVLNNNVIGVTLVDKELHPIFTAVGFAAFDSERKKTVDIFKAINPLVDLDDEKQKILAQALLPYIADELKKQNIEVHYQLDEFPIQTIKPRKETLGEKDWAVKLDFSKEDIISADSPDELRQELVKILNDFLGD